MKRVVALFAFLVVYCLAAVPARADSVLLSVSGTTAPLCCPATLSSGAGNDASFFGMSFVFGASFTDVTISIPNFWLAAGTNAGTAWLTNAIGAVTTSANVIASSPFSVCQGFSCRGQFGASVQFLSGLTLSPGTYYFFLSTPLNTPDNPNFVLGGAMRFADPVISTATNVGAAGDIISVCGASCAGAANQLFPPASTWTDIGSPANSESFLITGTLHMDLSFGSSLAHAHHQVEDNGSLVPERR